MELYYFSRTGNAKRIAEEIGKAKALTPHPISDGKNWSGVTGFLKAGAAASRKDHVEITYHPVASDLPLILVFPVWAGTLPPAIRSFLSLQSNKEITAVALSAGTDLKLQDQSFFSTYYATKGKFPSTPKELL